MQSVIEQFDVHEYIIQQSRNLLKKSGPAIAGGFQGAVHPGQAQKDFPKEGSLHQRFAAGKGNASAVSGIVVGIFQDPKGQFFGSEELPRNLPQVQGTDRNTIPAGNAGLVGTGPETAAAVGAGGMTDHQLGLGAQSFRIVAPAAAQRASFEENGLP